MEDVFEALIGAMKLQLSALRLVLCSDTGNDASSLGGIAQAIECLQSVPRWQGVERPGQSLSTSQKGVIRTHEAVGELPASGWDLDGEEEEEALPVTEEVLPVTSRIVNFPAAPNTVSLDRVETLGDSTTLGVEPPPHSPTPQNVQKKESLISVSPKAAIQLAIENGKRGSTRTSIGTASTLQDSAAFLEVPTLNSEGDCSRPPSMDSFRSFSGILCNPAPKKPKAQQVWEGAGQKSKRAQKSCVLFASEEDTREIEAEEEQEDYASSFCHSFEPLPIWKYGDSTRDTSGREISEEIKAKNRFLIKAATKNLDIGEVNSSGRKHTGTKFGSHRFLVWAEMRLWGLIINPHSFSRIAWDLTSVAMVCYDLLLVPMQLFDPPRTLILEIMDWMSCLFWTCDIMASFLTGYTKDDGNIEMNPRIVVRRYFKTWFVVDSAIVGINWIELSIASAEKVTRMVRFGKATRAFRVLRMLRLLRLVRVRQVMTQFFERIHSERLVVLLHLTQLTVMVLCISHLLGCAWYGVGRYAAGEDGWVWQYGLEDESFAYRYTTALHWSFAQFASGLDEFSPTNIVERTFALTAAFIGLVGCSAFISSLTSGLTQLQMLLSRQTAQLTILRRYLSQVNVPSHLASRVQRNAHFVLMERNSHMREDSVELLSMISEPLRMELHFETFRPVFAEHPFFGKFIDVRPEVMRKVCHSAMRSVTMASGDIIFNAGESPSEPKMFFILSGKLQYIPDGNGDIVGLNRGMHVAEPTLWIDWTHRGLLRATTEGEMCELLAKDFQTIVNQFGHCNECDPREYAENFVEKLNNRPESAPLDLPDDEEDEQEECTNWFALAFKQRRTFATRVTARASRFSWHPNRVVAGHDENPGAKLPKQKKTVRHTLSKSSSFGFAS